MPRSDALLIKHLAETKGLDVAQATQRMPLVCVDDALLASLGDPRVDIHPKMDPLEHLPWASFVIDMSLFSAEEPLRVWVKVCEVAVTTGPDILCEGIGFFRGRWLPMYRWAIDRHDPYCVRMEEQPESRQAKLFVRDTHDTAVRLIKHIMCCPERPVEISPRPVPRSAKADKTARLKPWLREDLARIVFIDPARARAVYGQPAPDATSRKAPRPHERRGHYRTLTNAAGEMRRVFVKPAWIGPTEWQHAGATYRVLAPRQPPAITAQ